MCDTPVYGEVTPDSPTSVCTFGGSSDVTMTVGKHVTVNLSSAEAVKLAEELLASANRAKEMRALELFYSKRNELDDILGRVCSLS